LKRVRPIDYRIGVVAIRFEAVPNHGMATIWDARRADLGCLPGRRGEGRRAEDLPPDGRDSLVDEIAMGAARKRDARGRQLPI
jgi:hypothetical protein